MSVDPAYFDWVAERVASEWPAGVMEVDDRRYIVGEIENVLFEVEPQTHDFGHVVRTRTDFARNVPDTEALHAVLLKLNRAMPDVTFGVQAEPSRPGCVAVKAFTALFGYDALNPRLLQESVRGCLAAAVFALRGGFIEKLGGEPGSAATKRELGID